MGEPRNPGDVPDAPAVDMYIGASDYDTDGDGAPDTAVVDDGVDLVLLTDLDGDRFADQVLRIGPDGVVREVAPPPHESPGSAVVDGLLGGADGGC